jgi:membrane protein DedA with SNARE-associated domain
LGDWLSYWIGLKLGPPVAHIWPLSRHPDLIPRGERFVKDWGVLAIFIGRFFGPLRASVPLVAGIFTMPFWRFQFANFTSAFLWAGVLLLFGDVAAKLLHAIREMMIASGIGWGTVLIWTLAILLLILGIAALVKYWFSRK